MTLWFSKDQFVTYFLCYISYYYFILFKEKVYFNKVRRTVKQNVIKYRGSESRISYFTPSAAENETNMAMLEEQTQELSEWNSLCSSLNDILPTEDRNIENILLVDRKNRESQSTLKTGVFSHTLYYIHVWSFILT